jgi:ERCC4-related helicase
MAQTLVNTLTKFDLHENNSDLFINVKQILESRDTETIKQLYDYVKKVCEDKTKINTAATDSQFDKKLTDNIHQFWNNYYTFYDNGNHKNFFTY